jgi:competence protein ComEA
MKFVRLLTILLFALFAAGGAAEPAGVGLIDVNHATAAELRTLPGIGDAYSLAIIKHRPYKNKTQLRSQGVIPLAAYVKIKDRIIAKH